MSIVVSAVICVDVNAATSVVVNAAMSEVASEAMVEVGSAVICAEVREEMIDIGAQALSFASRASEGECAGARRKSPDDSRSARARKRNAPRSRRSERHLLRTWLERAITPEALHAVGCGLKPAADSGVFAGKSEPTLEIRHARTLSDAKALFHRLPLHTVRRLNFD
jgi:hypothetical protein